MLKYVGGEVDTGMTDTHQGSIATEGRANASVYGSVHGGIPFIADYGVKGSIDGSVSDRISDLLDKRYGLNITGKQVDELIYSKAQSIVDKYGATGDAVTKARVFVKNLTDAIKSNDIQRISNLLGLSGVTNNIKETHAQGSGPARQIQGIWDNGAGAMKSYLYDLGHTLSGRNQNSDPILEGIGKPVTHLHVGSNNADNTDRILHAGIFAAGSNQPSKGEESINPDESKKENLTPPDNLDMR
ncbi:hypothetical protein [Hippea maritima]|uniref:Uncharacterized protein n=1 Tax=Hippea maritima (strain ATCC 700847 / DSM 10411 / MH2) TaxID=760142 RepID=F2LWL1_HIPMA|nr:hypothetical protein [Hippea maritima]AEA34120.1 hypothetical protein Hipma_1157 [Hippea maritima DSM 10411]